MRLHRGASQFIAGMLSIVALDLLTHKLWLIILYLCGWSLLLLRQSKRVVRLDGVTAPVSGIVTRVFKSTANNKEVECVKIETRPILDPQTLRVVPSDIIDSVKFGQDYSSILYRSGLVIKHVPYFKYSRLAINQDNIESFAEVESNSIYGWTMFGCSTIVILPNGTNCLVVEGQKVIDGETLIGRQV